MRSRSGSSSASSTSHAATAGRAEHVLDRMKSAGLKMTPQRMAIVRHFAEDATHPTAQELFDRLQGEFPTMSFATVYNTLDALAVAGLCGTLRLGSAARFDPNTEAHHHAVCERCGSVRDIPAGSLAPSRPAARQVSRVVPGFAVRTVERTYRGLCSACTKGAKGKPPARKRADGGPGADR
jgi:Fe2+ or Zn2+ uptake regulation protein